MGRRMNKVRLGIIGLGNMGKFHADYLLNHKVSRGELTAVSDAIPANLERYQQLATFGRSEELIRSGLEFIGTNPDRTYPTPGGLIPGAGAILAAVEAATDICPTIMGKPSPEMYRVAMERLETRPEETLVVGDRLETDIAGGQQLGCKTGLVLSGVTSLQAAHSWIPAPDWIEQDLTALLDRL